ncbi:MAG: DNA gyrase inhibitor YacG [Pirellulales bacterium]|nr:DNA gyrase inhibitor YacG [Pirellulales bacterium]
MSFQSDMDAPGEGPTDLESRPDYLDRKKDDTRRRCSYCEKLFEAASSPCLPFCSTRCQQIDLGKWLTESYGLPLDGHEDVEHDHVEE